ncbi:hypothetical protein [Amycolatopsis japonica]
MTVSWSTVTAERQVLAVTRTWTSLDRIRDLLPIFADDPRVQVIFTVDQGSVFSVGLFEHLRGIGMRVISWEEAITREFDAILAASDHSDLHLLRGPLVLLPHGAGYQKYTVHSADDHRELSGLTGTALRHDRRTIPASVALSHPNQLDLLRAATPDADTLALVVGDPCMDRLRALSRNRDRYRAALGVEPHQRLITVTSTWGPGSALGRWPTLPADLLTELDHDRYRVAAVLHPNVWTFHGSWQVRHWLTRATDAGLILLSPDGPWHLGLVAAHAVLGDHGSLSAYTSGLGHPLLLAAFDESQVPPETAMASLGQKIPRLERHRSLGEQIQDALDNPNPGLLADLADQVFSHPGEALARIRRRTYELLALPEPPYPPAPATVVPEIPPIRRPRSFQVETEVLPDEPETVYLHRIPARLAHPGPTHRHLLAYDDEPDETILQNAGAILTDDPHEDWAATTLTRYPGCLLVAAPSATGTLGVWFHDGARAEITTTTNAAAWDNALSVSGLYALLSHRNRRTGEILVRAGLLSGSVVVTGQFGEPRPPADDLL